MKKIWIFLSYDWSTKFLFLEAFSLLGWAYILKSIPFSKTASILGQQMYETTYEINQSNVKTLKRVSQAVNTMSYYTPWESMCLVKAIAAMKMLERRKIESTLYLGTAKDESGKMIAHAWLRSGASYITGFEEMERYTVVGKFGKEIRVKGDSHGKQSQSQYDKDSKRIKVNT